MEDQALKENQTPNKERQAPEHLSSHIKKIFELAETVTTYSGNTALGFISTQSKSIKVVDLSDRELDLSPMFILKGHCALISSLHWNDLSCRLYSGAEDGEVKIWKLQSETEGTFREI